MANGQKPEVCTRCDILDHHVLSCIVPHLIPAVEGDDTIVAVMIHVEGGEGAPHILEDHVQALQKCEKPVQLILRNTNLVTASCVLCMLGRQVQRAASYDTTPQELDA